MKKTITAAIVASLLSMVAMPAMADNGRRGHDDYKHIQKSYKEQQKSYRKYQKDRYKYEREHNRYEHNRYNDRYGNRYYERNRYEPHYRPPVYSSQRVWRRGEVLDRSYRGRGYWVNDYRQYPRLYAPAKNQRWVRVDNDYILVNTLSNVIVSILTGR